LTVLIQFRAETNFVILIRQLTDRCRTSWQILPTERFNITSGWGKIL